MPIFQFRQARPDIDPAAYIAPTATIIGDVTIKKNASIWFNCVLRGDVARLTVGENTNIQDLTLVHGDMDKPTTIGNRVSIGHNCVIHGCTIHDDCLIGMGSTILSDTVIGEGSVVAAGAVILEGTVIPPHSLVAGVPGKVKRGVTGELRQRMENSIIGYAERSKIYNTKESFSRIE